MVQEYRVLHGFTLRAWLSNTSAIGRAAWGMSGTTPDGFGLEYPAGSGIEHLYGAGPWVGAVMDTAQSGPPVRIKAVTTGYEGWAGPLFEMFGRYDGRDSFFFSSIDRPDGKNRRRFDDDADGRTDEDELDGTDNDGDWNPLVDDVGTDGLPDKLEAGCKGGYDPVLNPDPAFDNFEPGVTDSCKPRYPFKYDRDLYTQNNGYPNTGEPHTDEDGAAVSEEDASVSYSDTVQLPVVPGHVPLGIRIRQSVYSWRNRTRRPVLPVEYRISNVGRRTLEDVYVGIGADCDVGPVSVAGYETRNYSGYLADLRTAFVQNALDRPSTPLGITLLGASPPIKALGLTFQWYNGQNAPSPDNVRYNLMASGTVRPDQNSIPGSETHTLLAVGPFPLLRPGDEISFSVALVSGDDLGQLRENAAAALAFHARSYVLPPVPPSPPLRAVVEPHRVKLDWRRRAGDPGCDPLETWDDSDLTAGALPDTHWRRKSPELRCPAAGPGPHSGGRVFEGFKVWRSDSPVYDERSFVLVRREDVADDLGFGYQTGLRYTLEDSLLVPGKRYWYSVTSYSIPVRTVVSRSDSTGVYYDTLFAPESESAISENVTAVDLPTAVETGASGRPAAFGLSEAFPNPFNSATIVRVDIPARSHVILAVFDVLGREVRRAADSDFEPGSYAMAIDMSASGSGIYFCRLSAGPFSAVRKILLMR